MTGRWYRAENSGQKVTASRGAGVTTRQSIQRKKRKNILRPVTEKVARCFMEVASTDGGFYE